LRHSSASIGISMGQNALNCRLTRRWRGLRTSKREQQREVRQRAAPARGDRARHAAVDDLHARQPAHRLEELAVVAGARAVEHDRLAARRQRSHELEVVRQHERAAVDDGDRGAQCANQ
jgi:hypothetical protein